MVAVARRFPRRGSGQPIVELLLKNGADPNYVNTQMPSGKPRTALEIARRDTQDFKRIELIDILNQYTQRT